MRSHRKWGQPPDTGACHRAGGVPEGARQVASHTAPGGAKLGAPAREAVREDGCQEPAMAALDPPPRTHAVQYTLGSNGERDLGCDSSPSVSFVKTDLQ